MSILFYLAAGLIALWLQGRTFYRRYRRWRLRKDRRSWREMTETGGYLFVAWSIFGLTVGGLIEVPRAWLGVGVGAAVGAFLVASWVTDREDADDGPA